MRKIYKAKVEYIEQIEGYIILILIDGKWSRCGSDKNFIKVWDFIEDAEAYIETNDTLEFNNIE
jgi:hypothetical protein